MITQYEIKNFSDMRIKATVKQLAFMISELSNEIKKRC